MGKYCNNKLNNSGVTMLELIIVIGIMAILTAVIVPQYLKYVTRSQKTKDLRSAEVIGQSFERAFAFDVDTYDIYCNWKPGNLKKSVTATVDGNRETYDVYLVISSENKGFFSGNTGEFRKKLSNGKCFYDIINEELGIRFEKEGRTNRANYVNDIMVPSFAVVGPHSNANGARVDRWRVCKRVSDGRLEVWSAYDLHDGASHGGKPCYRVWPVPDDIYK